MKAMLVLLAVCGIVSWLSAAGASAATYRVNNLRRLEGLVEESANPGDIIEVAPGKYDFTYDRINIQRSGTPDAPITIRGISDDAGNRPVIDASNVNVHRGMFTVGDGVHDIVIENLEMCNARGSRFPDRVPNYGVNACAVFLAGCRNVTVRNCNIHDCEDGLFSTHWADCILVDNCEIHHNGTTFTGRHNATHNFYFCAHRQIVRNCYIHNSTEGENFKSRAGNTIFAYNWVDEEYIYSVAVDSGGDKNTLWVGNVVMKRTNEGHSQGRLLGVGDGTGVAAGTLVALNNTFITIFPRDFYLFTEKSSTCDVVLINNVFAGPGKVFLEKNGQGSVTGTNNWIEKGIEGIPDTLTATILGDDPGFVDQANFDLHVKADSPLVNAGAPRADFMKYVKMVTDNAREVTDVAPSPIYLKAISDVEDSIPSYEPVRKGHGYVKRPDDGKLDIGAYEYAR